jgi:hypothetical protein
MQKDRLQIPSGQTWTMTILVKASITGIPPKVANGQWLVARKEQGFFTGQ